MTSPETSGPAGRPVGRRHLLQGGAAAAAGVALGWTGRAAAEDRNPTAAEPAQPAGGEVEPFHGEHQGGVDTAAQSFVSLLGLDLRPDVDREALGRLLLLLSDDAARLTQGRPSLADTEPELAGTPSRLTVTFGLGPRVFTDLLDGLPAGAADELPAFSTDALEDQWGQTDLLLQVCADDPVAVAHARKVLLRDAKHFARNRWQQDGFRPTRGTLPAGATMRNLMGQVDGTVNPVPGTEEFDRQVWIRSDSSTALAGGTQMVVRRIRMNLTTWEKVDRVAREFTMGRSLDNGAPLTGKHERDLPDYDAKDEFGFPVIDVASHIRRAHAFDPAELILRRGYNYDVLTDGEPDSGLLFVSFQSDVRRQYVPVQQRLAEQDLLNKWVSTIGSAVYTVLPGCRSGGFVGETVLRQGA